MRHLVALALVFVATSAVPAQGQLFDRFKLDKINRQMAGQVVDFTHNHGADRRIYSPILGQPRDLYVYLPPCYNPAKAYPLIIYFHMAAVDEHWFVGSARLRELDAMIQSGEFPPVIVAVPDGLIEGENKFHAPHSMFLNGVRGRFEDHVISEVLPFMTSRYSIRPEREARALLGSSAGGLGASSLALRHPDLFGAVATVGGLHNLRYDTCSGDYRENFDPLTYRWQENYDPNKLVAKFYLGLTRVRARKFLEPVFGNDVVAVRGEIAAVNPADILFTAPISQGRPAIYINYAGHDNFNFDAQAESFIWLARSQGIHVDAEVDPKARHNLLYFRRNHILAYHWLASHLLPPTSRASIQ